MESSVWVPGEEGGVGVLWGPNSQIRLEGCFLRALCSNALTTVSFHWVATQAVTCSDCRHPTVFAQMGGSSAGRRGRRLLQGRPAGGHSPATSSSKPFARSSGPFAPDLPQNEGNGCGV